MDSASASHGQELFSDIGRHLMGDPAPSAYLDAAGKGEGFREYPFGMLAALQETDQPPEHHREGSVWNHTLMVVDEAAAVRCVSKDPAAFMWAALLHDIGKPGTTKVRKGRITSYDHDRLGEGLAREFLAQFTSDGALIDRVSKLIRYHMQILYVEKGLRFADIGGMRAHSDPLEVALLGLCDRLGRAGADRVKEEENISAFILKCRERHLDKRPESFCH